MITFKYKILNWIPILLFLVILANSCNKKDAFSNEKLINTRNESTEPSTNEPDYEYFGKSLYEFAKHYQKNINAENFFLSAEYSDLFRSNFDSIMDYYANFTYEEILNDFEIKGYISTELKNQRLSLYNDLDNSVDDVIGYLDDKINHVKDYNLSPDEEYTFKSELYGLKYSYNYISEIDNIPIDSSLEYRGGPGDCDIDWLQYIKDLRIYVISGSAVGAAIGSIIPGLGTAVGGGIGAIVGLGIGLMEEWDNTDQNQRFCEACIPAGVSREFSGTCDGSALFLAEAGQYAYKFKWDPTNGEAEHEFTVPGQKNRIWQIDPNSNLVINVTSYCHYDEDTDLQLSKNFGPYNLFNEQNEVPDGALFYDGIDYFKFPSPSSNNYYDYTYSFTETYYLGGLAILFPEQYTIEGIVSTQNASSEELDGNKLTVTWKVDLQHWDEFYGNGAFGKTEGIVNISVKNNCQNGETRNFPLNVIINHGHP